MRKSTSMFRTGGVALAAGLSLALSGCATLSSKSQQLEMFWPDPPEKTRIRYVRSVRSQGDLGGPSVFEVVVGKEPRSAVQQPMGLATSDDGQRLYVVDFAWSGVFVFDFAAKTVRFVGDARNPLNRPIGVALDGSENVYISDNSRMVKVYDRNGKFVQNIGKDQFVKPTGIAIDRERGRLYVVDTGRNDARAHQVKVFDLRGKLLREIGKRGTGDGEFNFPTFATVDKAGRLYVVDTANNRIQVFNPDGEFLFKFGRAGDQIGDFGRPKDVALDGFGNIYVVDSHWSNVQIFNARGQLLLSFAGPGTHPGLLLNPTGIAIDGQNKIYVSNMLARRVEIYQLVNTTAEDSLEAPKVAQKPGENIK